MPWTKNCQGIDNRNSRMRLTQQQLSVIRSPVAETFGESASVWLFGSRVGDNKRGGDVDLLVCMTPWEEESISSSYGQANSGSDLVTNANRIERGRFPKNKLHL
jgi:predicted nucleotidyltransferase